MTEPSSVPLIILCNYPWTPAAPHDIPERATLSMGKRLAATLEIELNTLEMDSRNSRGWHVVVLGRDGGFSVCRIMVNRWTPSSPFDLPPDAGDFVAPNVAVRSCARSFNRRQMDVGSLARHRRGNVPVGEMAVILGNRALAGHQIAFVVKSLQTNDIAIADRLR